MKETFKRLFRGISIVTVLPLLLAYYIGSCVFEKNKIFAAYSQLLSLMPGKVGIYFRSGFYRFVMAKYKPDCVISFATIFSQINTEIETGTYIGSQCNIGMCKIGRNCLIGSGVHILSGRYQHNYTNLDTPIKQQGGQYEKIIIGEDTWIGNGALIMANIGIKCVIAAGSVVVNDIDDYSIVAGNPATTIRKRSSLEELV
jgi:acetyltransferase-like isoleucine patch superfamily enzyme